MPFVKKVVNFKALANDTHRIFVRRVTEEMKARDLGDNELTIICEKMGFDIGQSTVSRITAGRLGKLGPSLTNIHAIACGLETQAWKLLKLSEGSNVLALPIPSRPIDNEPDRQESRLSPRQKRRRR